MNTMFFSYIKYLFKAKHRRGFGIHSPFLFSLITEVIECKLPYYKYSLFDIVRNRLIKSNKIVSIGNNNVTIKKIAKKDCKNKYYCQLLMRLANHFKAKTIIEVGTSLGLSTLHLAAANSKSKVITIEKEKEVAKTAQHYFNATEHKNIELLTGHAETLMPDILKRTETIDMLYIDIDDTKASAEIYNQARQKYSDNAICIIGDPHSSIEKEKLWEELKADTKVRVSLDIYGFGILIFNKELQKEDFTLMFLPWLNEI